VKPLRSLLLALACLGLAGAACAADIQVTATLDPERIDLGEAAQLSVAVEGSSAKPVLPTVDGLQFTPTGQASSFQWINGVTSRSTTYTYQVTAERAGAYAIPPIAVESLHSVPLRLTVGNGGGNAGAAPGGAPGEAAPEEKGQLAFLRLILPKKEFYVGELVPAEIRAYFRSGMRASLEDGPSLASAAFTLNPVTGKPRQVEETIDGQPYSYLTWPTALSAVKPGPASLDLTLPVEVLIPQRVQQGRNANDPFGDPFFQQAFAPMVRKQLTLRNEPTPVTVLPLPAENRPADFAGAVGRFTVEAEVTPRQAAEGDPLTLRFKVSGQGNFDRVLPKLLTGAPGWRAYAPSAKFEPQDAVGAEGVKTFEQAIIPAEPGKREVPALSFSFFDPETRQYVTRTTAPIEVAITPAPASAAPHVAPSAAPTASAAPAPAPGLVANKVALSHPVASLTPVTRRPWFAAVLAAPLLLLVLGVAGLRFHRLRAGDLARRRREARDRAIGVHLARLDRAQAAGDAAAFFDAARAALQQSLGERWHLQPESITLAEIEARAGQVSDTTRAFFRRADEAAYSGGTAAGDDLAAWRQQLDRELAAPEIS
jgi:hypothetical protein